MTLTITSFLEAARTEIEKLSDALAAMPVTRKAVKGGGKSKARGTRRLGSESQFCTFKLNKVS